MIDVGEALERESHRFRQEPGASERLTRRRDRKRRNERVGAAAVAVSLSVALIGALMFGYRSRGVPSAPPGFVQNGRIAFSRWYSADPGPIFVTYLANRDGSDVRRLPGGASWQPFPRWSPDGRQVAVTEPRAETPQCPKDVICTTVIVDVETGAYRGIPWTLPGTWDVDCFPWSPDATRLACGAIDDNGTDLSGIYTVRASDGGDPVRITPCGPCVPGDFSPDGRRLVFSSLDPDGHLALFVVGLDGGGLRRITPEGMVPNGVDGGRWSPAGDRIVFQARKAPDRQYSIWVVNPEGGDLQQIPIEGCGGSLSAAGSGACRMPAWSPDGTKIVFSYRSQTETSVAGLYVVNADGSGLARLTNDGRDDQPDWGTNP